MGVNPRLRESMYRAYMEFFEIAEKKRRWNIWDDIPWDRLDPSRNEEADAVRLETFCGVELYVPDYVVHGFGVVRPMFPQAWFLANWGYEESKHALVFREYLTRSGLRSAEQYRAYEAQIFSQVWQSQALTMRQTNIYGALQEIATYFIYHLQYKKAQSDGNPVLERVFHYVSRDEAAHCGFYRKMVLLEMAEDPQGTLEDLAQIVMGFEMPGLRVIPDYERRVLTEGVGLTREQFMSGAVFPTLRHFGTTRSDLVRTIRARRARDAEAPAIPTGAAATTGTDHPAALPLND
jgi:acyl-[acyl-carrier protein] desaturase